MPEFTLCFSTVVIPSDVKHITAALDVQADSVGIAVRGWRADGTSVALGSGTLMTPGCDGAPPQEEDSADV